MGNRLEHPDSSGSRDGDLILNQREHKFLLDAHTAFSIWQVATQRLARQRCDGGRPLSYVRTTYFDTPDYAYYRGSGTPLSRRLRVREYAAASEPGAVPELTGVCVLELKQSAAGRRSKSRVVIAPGDVGAYLQGFTGGADDAPLEPCMTTWYQRAALTDADDRLRVTLDAGIRYCAPTPLGSPCVGLEPPEVIAHGPAFVLEIKLWDEPPIWLARAIRDLKEAVGFSKFTAGMRAAEACGRLNPARDPASTDGAWPAESLGA
jgi:hypothetical protein